MPHYMKLNPLGVLDCLVCWFCADTAFYSAVWEVFYINPCYRLSVVLLSITSHYYLHFLICIQFVNNLDATATTPFVRRSKTFARIWYSEVFFVSVCCLWPTSVFGMVVVFSDFDAEMPEALFAINAFPVLWNELCSLVVSFPSWALYFIFLFPLSDLCSSLFLFFVTFWT